MAKIVLNNITSGYASTAALNANNDAIEAALEKTLSRDGTGPNQMNSALDMNGNRILNQANPITVEGFNWEGPWTAGTIYTIGDVVEDDGTSYIAIETHEAGVVFSGDVAKWQVVAKVAYPDQAGEAGKFLQTNGVSPSWQLPLEVYTPYGVGAVDSTIESKLRERVSVKDFGALGNGVADDTAAIQAALDSGAKSIYMPAGTYKTSAPLKTYSEITLYGDGVSSTIIEKTTATAGSGTATARSGAITDNYAGDHVLQVVHVDDAYAYYVRVEGLSLKKTSYAANSIGIFAPRMSRCHFKNIHVQNVTKSLVTYDAWMCSYHDYTSQAVERGICYESDGSGAGAGTSAKLSNCWVNFDNTVVEPLYGHYFYGLTYSSLDACGCDNGTRVDGLPTYAYFFTTCDGISVDGCGVENHKGTVFYLGSSSVVATNLKTYRMTGVATGTVATVFVDTASKLTLIGCSFAATTTAGVLYDWVVQNGATVVEINPHASPSGGNTFVSYSSGATRTRVVGTAITRSNSSGYTTAAFPTSGSAVVTMIAGTSGTITLDASYDEIFWHRVGNAITVTGKIQASSVSSPVGVLKIVGALPVAAGAAANKTASVSVVASGLNAGATTSVVGSIIPGTSDILLNTYNAGALADAASYIKAASSITVSGTYLVD